MSRSWWRLLTAAYVGVVAVLAASAFWSPDAGFSTREGLAFLLTLPSMLPALPVLYVVGAGLWNITGADSGGPMWPVTVGFTLMFAGTALLNAWLATLLWSRRHRRTPAPVPVRR